MSLDAVLLAPELVPWLLVVPALAGVFAVLEVRRRRALVAFVGPRAEQLVGSARGASWLVALHGLGLLCGALALLRPVWGVDASLAAPRGVDILVALDVSRSMLARDLAPSRLVAARREIAALARRARGDRVGLIAFAGEARLVAPLTQDVETYVQLVDECDPTSVAKGGTDLGAALERALGALEGASGDHETIVLVTDGEDHEKRGLRAAEACRQRKVVVHCVGFGTMLGSKIAVADGTGERFLQDAQGNDVVTALDPTSLAELANATGGGYLAAGSTEHPLVTLYERRILPMARKAFAERERSARISWFQVPLLLAFVLLLLELFATTRARRDST